MSDSAADGRPSATPGDDPTSPTPPPSTRISIFRRSGSSPSPSRSCSRALTTWNGWTFRPVDPYTIDVLDAQNRGHRLTLDRLLDRRWWAYSFIPPAPEAGHPRPLAAIACEAGVALYRLDDGVRTRLLAGHNGPVYALAPSPDGKWLVTGSPDQTVRLWRLGGMDIRRLLVPASLRARWGGRSWLTSRSAASPRPWAWRKATGSRRFSSMERRRPTSRRSTACRPTP